MRARTEDFKRKRGKGKKNMSRKRKTKEREEIEKIQQKFDTKNCWKFHWGIKDIKTGYVPRVAFYKDEEGKLLGNKERRQRDGL